MREQNENDLQSKLNEVLCQENYQAHIKYLHRLGSCFRKKWGALVSSEASERRKYIQDKLASPLDGLPQSLEERRESVSNLEVILTVWEEPGLSREKVSADGQEAPNALRYRLKIKDVINKANRGDIHRGLIAAVIASVQGIINLEDINANYENAETVQRIKQALETAIARDKIDNNELIKILKDIRSLLDSIEENYKESCDLSTIKNIKEIVGAATACKKHNEVLRKEFFDPINIKQKHDLELLAEIFTKVNENKEYAKQWLKKFPNSSMQEQVSSATLLEAMLSRINENKMRNTQLKEALVFNGYHNKKLLKNILARLSKNEEHHEKLLTKIIEQITENEKAEKELLKKITARIAANEEGKETLEKKLAKANKSKARVDCSAENKPLIELEKEGEITADIQGLLDHNEALKGVQDRIYNNQNSSVELLKKIYSISKNKKRIEKLLRKNYDIRAYAFEAWNQSQESIEKSQAILVEVKATVKFGKVKKAITGFKTTGGKILSGVSFVISFLAGLACGIVTGGLLFVLVTGGVAITMLAAAPLAAAVLLGVVVFAAGFYANFRFFEKAIPAFLLKLGRIGGYIDENGERAPLSTLKKRLFFPVAFLFSASVGYSVGAFTFLKASTLLAVLAVVWPPLPFIIAGVLAFTLAVAMAVIMFSAYAKTLQTPFSFSKLCEAFRKVKRELTFKKGLAYVLKAGLILFAIIGLACLCFASAPAGIGIATFICMASLIGQIPFTVLTVNNFCDFVWAKLRGKAVSSDANEGLLSCIVGYVGLILNAMGNAGLVFSSTIWGCVSSAACLLNSFAGNLIKGDDNDLVAARNRANKMIIQGLCASKDNGYRAPARTVGRPIPAAPIPIPAAKRKSPYNGKWWRNQGGADVNSLASKRLFFKTTDPRLNSGASATTVPQRTLILTPSVR